MRWSEQLAQGAEQFLEDLRVSWRIMIMLSLLHVSVVFFLSSGRDTWSDKRVIFCQREQRRTLTRLGKFEGISQQQQSYKFTLPRNIFKHTLPTAEPNNLVPEKTMGFSKWCSFSGAATFQQGAMFSESVLPVTPVQLCIPKIKRSLAMNVLRFTSSSFTPQLQGEVGEVSETHGNPLHGHSSRHPASPSAPSEDGTPLD